jgi:hypothetical protein
VRSNGFIDAQYRLLMGLIAAVSLAAPAAGQNAARPDPDGVFATLLQNATDPQVDHLVQADTPDWALLQASLGVGPADEIQANTRRQVVRLKDWYDRQGRQIGRTLASLPPDRTDLELQEAVLASARRVFRPFAWSGGISLAAPSPRASRVRGTAAGPQAAGNYTLVATRIAGGVNFQYTLWVVDVPAEGTSATVRRFEGGPTGEGSFPRLIKSDILKVRTYSIDRRVSEDLVSRVLIAARLVARRKDGTASLDTSPTSPWQIDRGESVSFRVFLGQKTLAAVAGRQLGLGLLASSDIRASVAHADFAGAMESARADAPEETVTSSASLGAGSWLSYLFDQPFPFAGRADLFMAGNLVCRMGADGAPLARALLARHRESIPWPDLVAEIEAKASAAPPKP